MATRSLTTLAQRTRGIEPCRQKVEALLALADTRIDGRRAWDIRVHDPRFYPRVLGDGSLGFGETYMEGWWDCDDLVGLISRVVSAKLHERVRTPGDLLMWARAKLVNLQSPARADEIAHAHYDIGNDLYERMLDRRMIYSCGYWAEANDLDAAQEAKLDLIFRKLGLEPGMRVLDIGCGWGGAAQFAAERYGVEVVGVTVSREQARLAEARCEGLPVEIRLQDYRAVKGRFDRIYSIGMFEHVGVKNYRTYFRVARDLLTPDGLFVLHTIGGNTPMPQCDRWIARYIFPNSVLPAPSQVTAACEGLFVIEDWHNFGVDYERTLTEWLRRFEAAWPELEARYDERFHRMWRYYLSASAGSFRARDIQLWQLVLSPGGVAGGYRAPR
ncbi:MAG: cyclopropane fatty acyl phospholipid synthase [Gammaproteobacteria bacterium]|nr:cyclopropane fatty acyl phospholipid synthase [Gammaproteobacteria bacterium]